MPEPDPSHADRVARVHASHDTTAGAHLPTLPRLPLDATEAQRVNL